MNNAGAYRPTPAQYVRPWRVLHVLSRRRILGGRDKRLRGAVHSWPGRSLDSQGFLCVDFEVHNFAPMWTVSEYLATLRLCRDVRVSLP